MDAECGEEGGVEIFPHGRFVTASLHRPFCGEDHKPPVCGRRRRLLSITNHPTSNVFSRNSDPAEIQLTPKQHAGSW